MTNIVFTAAGTAAEAVVSGKLTAGIVGVPVTFNLNEEWNGLNVIAVFEGGGNRISLPLLGRKTIPLPWEVVARPNIRLRIGAEGRAEDGSVVIPTVWADAGYVAWGVNATQGSDPSPTAFDLLMAEIRKVSEGHLAVVDNLETKDPNRALSANMGVVLREKIENDLLTLDKETQAQLAKRVQTVNGVAPDESGNVVVEQVSDEQINDLIEAATEERFVTLEEVVQGIVDEMNYKNIDITAFACPGAGTYEMGQSVAAPTITWTLNKAPASQSLNSEALGVDVRSKAYSGSLISNKTYTLTVTGQKGEKDSASGSFTFYNGVYYGSMVAGSAINNAAILSLTKKLQSGRSVSFRVSSNRPVYACPTRYGTPMFTIGGFEYEWDNVATFDFTNASGYVESYSVWMHTQNVSGSVTINVT